MERNREARRASRATETATAPAINGLARRRQQRLSLEEHNKAMGSQESARLRDRTNRRDAGGEGDRLNWIKRRREESSEDSVEDDEGGEKASLLSMSNHSHPGSVSAPKTPAWKIGVPVPRKARSASVKRSHEYWVSGGGVEPSIDSVSSTSTTFFTNSKMKFKIPPCPTVKPSASIVEDIEIEVAEVLYDLMKQSQRSKTQDCIGSSSQKMEHQGTSSISSPSPVPVTAQISVATKKQKLLNMECEEESSAALVSKALMSNREESYAGKEQPVKMDASSPKSEKSLGSNVESCEVSSDVDAAQAVAVSLELQEMAFDSKDDMKPLINREANSDQAVGEEDPVSLAEEESVKFNIESNQEKFEIDLMGSPTTALPPARDNPANSVSSDPEATTQETKKVDNLVSKEDDIDANGEKYEVPKLHIKKDPITETRRNLERREEDNNSVCSVRLQRKQLQAQLLQPKASIPKVVKIATLPPLGPTLPMVGSMNCSSGSFTTLQPPNFLLPPPQPRRCITHQYIAQKIYYNQQLTKLSNCWPVAAGLASLQGAKPYNPNVMTVPESMILGNPANILGGIFGIMQDKVQHGSKANGKQKSLGVVNSMVTTPRKQLLSQQASQPVPVGGLLHPGFIPLSQHQATAASQPGPPKTSNSANNGSLSSNAAMAVSYPNFPANEVPYLAILPCNGYPFMFSPHIRASPASIGGTPAQATPYFKGSMYSPQMFHAQIQQQPPCSQAQAQAQPVHHKTSGEHVPAGRVQTLNFAATSSGAQGSGGAGCTNYGEKQQQLQVRNLKGTVELVPSQAFALSFASFNRNSTTSGLDFSSKGQNPTIFCSLADMGQHGFPTAAQVVHRRGHQTSESKSGSDLANSDDGRKTVLEKSPASAGHTIVFCKPGSADPSFPAILGTSGSNSSARTLNFMSSQPVGSTTIATNAQPQQMIKLQKQNLMRQHPQGVANVYDQPSSKTTKLAYGSSVFNQTPTQSNCSARSSQWTTVPSVPQQQGRASQGHTKISFGGNRRKSENNCVLH